MTRQDFALRLEELGFKVSRDTSAYYDLGGGSCFFVWFGFCRTIMLVEGDNMRRFERWQLDANNLVTAVDFIQQKVVYDSENIASMRMEDGYDTFEEMLEYLLTNGESPSWAQ